MALFFSKGPSKGPRTLEQVGDAISKDTSDDFSGIAGRLLRHLGMFHPSLSVSDNEFNNVKNNALAAAREWRKDTEAVEKWIRDCNAHGGMTVVAERFLDADRKAIGKLAATFKVSVNLSDYPDILFIKK